MNIGAVKSVLSVIVTSNERKNRIKTGMRQASGLIAQYFDLARQSDDPSIAERELCTSMVRNYDAIRTNECTDYFVSLGRFLRYSSCLLEHSPKHFGRVSEMYRTLGLEDTSYAKRKIEAARDAYVKQGVKEASGTAQGATAAECPPDRALVLTGFVKKDPPSAFV
jgi:hypothetical protein